VSEKLGNGRHKRAATLADVGREAGVSAMAASAVLNGPTTSARVSSETRDRVLVAAQKLRYRPNQTARGLVERRINTLGLVGILAGDEPNLYFLEVFNGLMQEATSHGQNVTVFNVGRWDGAHQLMRQYCDGRVDGLILLGPMIDAPANEWMPEHVPVVAVHPNHPLPGVPIFRSDDEGGACLAVNHLLRLGHRRILHVGGPEGSVGADLRLLGYQRAFRDAGIEQPPGHTVRGAFTAAGGRGALEEWLQSHKGEPLPEAIFAGSDAIALGCLERLKQLGLRVPEDVSLVGFDNTLFARATGLSTVAQPLGKFGRLAVQALLDLINSARDGSATVEVTNIVLETELVDRSTVAGPRSLDLRFA
jgi:DNA-binding LacI/PurR family transcriptional regulator